MTTDHTVLDCDTQLIRSGVMRFSIASEEVGVKLEITVDTNVDDPRRASSLMGSMLSDATNELVDEMARSAALKLLTSLESDLDTREAVEEILTGLATDLNEDNGNG